MTTVTITLPDQLLEFVRAQAAEGGYESPSDYLRVLLLEMQHLTSGDAAGDTQQQRLERLRADIRVGVNQVARGEFSEFDDTNLGDLAREVRSTAVRTLRELKHRDGK